jgi:DNA-binding transcriptional LysR family regulator
MASPSIPANALEGLSTDRIEAFLAVAEAGSIARVAAGDPSRQSLISRQLRAVSAAVGFEAFERHGRGLRLTARGHELHRLLRDFTTALRELRAQSEAKPVEATLVAGDSVLRWLLLPLLPAVTAANPGVNLSLRAVNSGFDRVREGEFDLAVSRDRGKQEGMSARRLGALKYQVFVPTARQAEAADHRGLAALPHVHVTGFDGLMERYAQMLGRAPTVALRCETFPQAAVAVATGQVAAVLPAVAVREIPASRAIPLAFKGLGEHALALALVARTRRLEAAPALNALFRALTLRLTAALGQ